MIIYINLKFLIMKKRCSFVDLLYSLSWLSAVVSNWTIWWTLGYHMDRSDRTATFCVYLSVDHLRHTTSTCVMCLDVLSNKSWGIRDVRQWPRHSHREWNWKWRHQYNRVFSSFSKYPDGLNCHLHSRMWVCIICVCGWSKKWTRRSMTAMQLVRNRWRTTAHDELHGSRFPKTAHRSHIQCVYLPRP